MRTLLAMILAIAVLLVISWAWHFFGAYFNLNAMVFILALLSLTGWIDSVLARSYTRP